MLESYKPQIGEDMNTTKKLIQSVLLLGCALSLTIGCTDKKSQEDNLTVNISSSKFGELAGKQIDLYTLTNTNGMQVKITNYGATVTSIIVPDKHGNKANVAAGFDTLEGYFSQEYVANSPYFGGIIGRYASVIKEATFSLNGQQYQLNANMGNHHLHGGVLGFDRQAWQAEPIKTADYVSLKLQLNSADGDEFYPGNLQVTVEYRLNNKNELSIHYGANTDKDTPLSLTNHTYFNLNGFTDKVLDHKVQLKSDAYLKPDDSGVADGTLVQVAGTVADFNAFKRLGDAFETLPMGFEHFYVFDNQKAALNKVATVKEEKSGRSLEIFTTEPGTLLYTGRYTSDNLAREDGTQFGQFRAFCIETSKYPNGPNISGSPRSILKAGDTYAETTVFKFSW